MLAAVAMLFPAVRHGERLSAGHVHIAFKADVGYAFCANLLYKPIQLVDVYITLELE